MKAGLLLVVGALFFVPAGRRIRPQRAINYKFIEMGPVFKFLWHILKRFYLGEGIFFPLVLCTWRGATTPPPAVLVLLLACSDFYWNSINSS